MFHRGREFITVHLQLFAVVAGLLPVQLWAAQRCTIGERRVERRGEEEVKYSTEQHRDNEEIESERTLFSEVLGSLNQCDKDERKGLLFTLSVI